MRMRIVVTALCVPVCLSIVSGDEVRVGRLVYSNATIIGVKDCVLSFTAIGGRLHGKHFSKVTGVTINGQSKLNQAERLVQLPRSNTGQADKLRTKAQAKLEQARKLPVKIRADNQTGRRSGG